MTFISDKTYNTKIFKNNAKPVTWQERKSTGLRKTAGLPSKKAAQLLLCGNEINNSISGGLVMSKLGISARVIIAIAFLFCVYPEDTGIAADFVQPNETFPAGSAPEAVAVGDVNHDGKNDIKVLPEESFPWPLFLPAIIAGKRTCPAIPNGDFESGNTQWSEYSELGYEIITNVPPTGFSPHSGSYAVWLGGADNEISFIGQQVPISSSCPFLTFYHWIDSSDVCGYDYGLVFINQTVVGTFDLCEGRDSGGWLVQSIDLSAYAGQTVDLIISAATDESVPSNWFIDDVSFQASAQ